MVAQADRDHLRIVGLIFFQAKDLRGAAFRRNAVRCGVKELITSVKYLINGVKSLINGVQKVSRLACLF